MGRFGDLLTSRRLSRIILTIITVLVLQVYTSSCCTPKERLALLQLKSYFISSASSADSREYVYRELSSWSDHGNTSCCLWDRVQCDQAILQHVTALDLSVLFDYQKPIVLNVTLFGPFAKLTSLDLSHNEIQRLVGSEGSNSLNLSNLEILDFSHNAVSEEQVLIELVGSLYSLNQLFLSRNNLGGSFPEQVLANLKQLRVLDLSYNSFNGSIQGGGVCKLKNLQELHVSYNALSGSLPRCLGYLTSLQVLTLSNNYLSGDVISIISNLTSLKHLSLSQNHFQGEFSLSLLLNHSKLENLKLSSSGFQVKIVDTLPHFQPTVLGLSDCSLHMQSSTLNQFLLHQHKLLWLDVSHNGLAGSFSTWILHINSRIQFLIMRNNSFEGILNLPPNARMHSLVFLDISTNQLSGPFPKNIGSIIPRLRYFNASNNVFEGKIPASMGNMTELSSLDLSNNHFFGEVPSSIFTKCTSLNFLMLSNNGLQGDILPEYMNLTQLTSLSLDNNHFNGTIKKVLLKSSELGSLDLSNNEVIGGIPSWMGNFSSLWLLSMSSNQLQGQIPSELYNLQSLWILTLSDNSLNGVIPSSYNLSRILVLSLRNNFLIGPLPIELSRSFQLAALDLSGNNFSGSIPIWINNLSHLNVLLLEHNWLQGELPVQLCQLHHINLMDLSSNDISGVLPSCLAKISFGKRSKVLVASLVINLENYFNWSGYMDDWDPLFDLEIRLPEEVAFLTKGRNDIYGGYLLDHMSGLSLSCNQLTGEIPQELGHMENIRALNLSHNRLSGSIPSSFSLLRSIESFDLSYNNLSGAIPFQLVDVTTLEIFNVSYNNLSGEVPESGQFASFDERNYKGNPFLCGSLLEHKCTTFPKEDTQQEDAFGSCFDWKVFLWSFDVSFITMFFPCIAVSWINPSWRRAWFQFIGLHVLWRLNLSL